jgi:hypothetical protein
MGLSISVGFLYDQARNDAEGYEYHRRAFARLSGALAEKGITWSEPEISDPPSPHRFSTALPYGCLTQLRRAYVLAGRGEPVTPAGSTDALQYKRDLGKVEDETSMLASHLLCHSDSAGYYVPVEFDDPLFLPRQAGVDGGGIVGSTQRLLKELVGMAPAIDLDLYDDRTLSNEFDDDDPFGSEKITWLMLYSACLAGIEGGHAIVFH